MNGDAEQFGVPTPRDPGGFARREQSEEDLQYLSDLGLPSDWWPYCDVVPADRPTPASRLTGSRLRLRVGHTAPPRSLDEMILATQLGVGLDLTLEDGGDLSPLAPALADALYLSVRSTRASAGLVGWGVLELARSLKVLIIGSALSEPVPVSELPDLQIVVGWSPLVAYAALNLSLAHLSIRDLGSWPEGLEIKAPLSGLDLWEASGFHELPRMAHPEKLEDLAVRGASSFDMESLDDLVNLSWLMLGGCRRVENASSLKSLTSLKTLHLDGVEWMPGSSVLFELPSVERITVSNQSIFPAVTANRVNDQSGSNVWIEPPRVRRDDRARARFAFDGDTEQDDTTFAPMVVVDRELEGGIPYVLSIPQSVLEAHADRTGETTSALMAVIQKEIDRLPVSLRENCDAPFIDPNGDVWVESVLLQAIERIATRIHPRFAAQ